MQSQGLSTITSVALNFIPGCQVWCSALFAAQRTYCQTGSLGAAFHAGGRSAAMSGVLMQIGGDPSLGIAGSPQNIFANAMVGGVASTLEGGKFGHGFFSAGVSSALKPMLNSIGGANSANAAIEEGSMAKLEIYKVHRVVGAALIGGTASVISGGKFINGAATSAFIQIYNAEVYNRETMFMSYVNERIAKEQASFDAYMQGMLTAGHAGKGHHLTYRESTWLWRNGGGAPIVVDGRVITVWNVTGEFAAPFPLDDLKVHGHVTTNRVNNRIFDGRYDFNVIPNPDWQLKMGIRNVLNRMAISEHGAGDSYWINYRYTDADFK
jgi:hypothetical protein